MKKILSFLTVFLTMLLATQVFAGGGGAPQNNTLSGSYPIVLVHGLLGYGDTGNYQFQYPNDFNETNLVISYWGGMVTHLRNQGAVVFAPGRHPVARTERRAAQLNAKILRWRAAQQTTHDTFHLIGHSQGGLDSRFLINHFPAGNRIRSLTTISTPHRGSPVAQATNYIMPNLVRRFIDGFVRSFGIVEQPNVNGALHSLSPEGMVLFNNTNPRRHGVNYYSTGSYFSILNNLGDLMYMRHLILAPAQIICAIVGRINGQGINNDGVVPFSSMSWGQWLFMPQPYDTNTSGLDHLEIANHMYLGRGVFDVNDFFETLAINAMNNQ